MPGAAAHSRAQPRAAYSVSLDLADAEPSAELCAHLVQELAKYLAYARGQCSAPFDQLAASTQARARAAFVFLSGGGGGGDAANPSPLTHTLTG